MRSVPADPSRRGARSVINPVMESSVTKGMSHPGYIHSDGLGEAELNEIWPDGLDRGPTVVRIATSVNPNYVTHFG